MKKMLKGMLALSALLAVVLLPGIALANKGSVTIDAPDTAKKGEEVTVKLNVEHCCVTKMHYVNWVYLQANGKEVKRWTYTSKELPPSPKFSLEYKYSVAGDTELKAEANCNLHGSAGPALKKIMTSK
jgi:desulfoferrodoxin (superoxide reductase-like protein)